MTDPIQALLTQLQGPLGFTVAVGGAVWMVMAVLKQSVPKKGRPWLALFLGFAFSVVLMLAGWFEPCAGDCDSELVRYLSAGVLGVIGTSVAFATHKKFGIKSDGQKE